MTVTKKEYFIKEKEDKSLMELDEIGLILSVLYEHSLHTRITEREAMKYVSTLLYHLKNIKLSDLKDLKLCSDTKSSKKKNTKNFKRKKLRSVHHKITKV